jgi:hypothetical protein
MRIAKSPDKSVRKCQKAVTVTPRIRRSGNRNRRNDGSKSTKPGRKIPLAPAAARPLPWSAATGECISLSNANPVAKSTCFSFGGGNSRCSDRLTKAV